MSAISIIRLLTIRLSFFLVLAAGCATNEPAPVLSVDQPPFKICRGLKVSNAPTHALTSLQPDIIIRRTALLRRPVKGCLSSGFGPRRGGAGNVHQGIDLFTSSPREIVAAGSGRVVLVSTLRGYGRTVDIDHGSGVLTRYAHLSANTVKQGERVEKGQTIGRTGRTGNATAIHLHYEIRVDDRPINPLARPKTGA